MNRTTLALVLMLSMPVDAAARCHAIWHYPYPQHCGVRLASIAPRQPRPAAGATLDIPAPAVRVPVAIDPRDQALDELKRELALHALGLQ